MSRPDRVIFRLPGVSLVIPFLFFICVTPLANAGPDWLLALYLLPVVGLVYILITRTVADPDVIRTTGLLGARHIAWSDLDGFEFRGPRWAIAIAQDGRRLRLPMVRPRDLPRLAHVSGGRLLLGSDAPTAGPDTAGPDIAGSDIAGSDIAGSDAAGPDAAGPDRAEPGAGTDPTSAALESAALESASPAAAGDE